MKIDLLIAEIGSTTTLVNGFMGMHSGKAEFIGQGLAPTSVLAGDVMEGLLRAIEDLKQKLAIDKLEWEEFMATSSAAGGLKMTVHGLVKDMTVKAAREAALGAGAVIRKVTAGKLKEYHLKEIEEINPNIILLAGGVDYGEEEVILHNASLLKKLKINPPLIYAGNSALQSEIKELFAGTEKRLLITENVYPEIDRLNVEAARKVIHQIFAKHIVKAPGMNKIKDMLSSPMLPTPGAVMEISKILYQKISNLVTIDVGGATTDVHSVTEDSASVGRILISPEPLAKRTVEGDLGVFLNADQVFEILKKEKIIDKRVDLAPLPRDEAEAEYIYQLAEIAAKTAVNRHAGQLRDFYGAGGRQTVAEGKDLTAVKWIIGTGGALTRLTDGEKILNKVKGEAIKKLIPPEEARILIDHNYIMASLGVMGQKYPEQALQLGLKSIAREDILERFVERK